jgi:hypothetical protein
MIDIANNLKYVYVLVLLSTSKIIFKYHKYKQTTIDKFFLNVLHPNS